MSTEASIQHKPTFQAQDETWLPAPEPAEIELLRELQEAGARLPSGAACVEIVEDWLHRHSFRRHEPAERVLAERMITAAVLRVVTADGRSTPLQAGQRAFCLQHGLRLGHHKTARALARELRVSPGRISQISRELNAERILAALQTLRITSTDTPES